MTSSLLLYRLLSGESVLPARETIALALVADDLPQVHSDALAVLRDDDSNLLLRVDVNEVGDFVVHGLIFQSEVVG